MENVRAIGARKRLPVEKVESFQLGYHAVSAEKIKEIIELSYKPRSKQKRSKRKN